MNDRKPYKSTFAMDRAFMEAVVSGYEAVRAGSALWTQEQGGLSAEMRERRRDGRRVVDVKIRRARGPVEGILALPDVRSVRIVESDGALLIIDAADSTGTIRETRPAPTDAHGAPGFRRRPPRPSARRRPWLCRRPSARTPTP